LWRIYFSVALKFGHWSRIDLGNAPGSGYVRKVVTSSEITGAALSKKAYLSGRRYRPPILLKIPAYLVVIGGPISGHLAELPAARPG
jgi:hypothetical protein